MNIRALIAFAFLFIAFPPQVFGEDKKFQLGFTLPLTGPFAEFGSAVQNALKLAQDDEAPLFEQVHVILEDDQYNAKNALSAFQKLKDVDGAGLILVWGNEPALAVAPVAESSHFPLIAFGQTPAIAAGRQNVLRVLGSADNFGKPIAEYLVKKDVSSIQMILVDNTFYRLVADSIHSRILKSTNFNVIASVPATETDFRTYLMKVKQSPKDSLGVFLSPAQLIPFFKQANELHVMNPIFGSTSFESKAVVTEARQLMNGAVYAHVTVDPAWHERYLKRFGNDIQVSYAAVAYDTLVTIARIITSQKAGVSGHLVLESLASLPEQHGASGKFVATSSAEHGRYINFEVALKKIVNGMVEAVPN